MCGSDPCIPLYADSSVKGGALTAAARRCGEQAVADGAVALEMSERPGRVRLEVRLLSGEGVVIELTPAAARSVGACLERTAEIVAEKTRNATTARVPAPATAIAAAQAEAKRVRAGR